MKKTAFVASLFWSLIIDGVDYGRVVTSVEHYPNPKAGTPSLYTSEVDGFRCYSEQSGGRWIFARVGGAQFPASEMIVDQVSRTIIIDSVFGVTCRKN